MSFDTLEIKLVWLLVIQINQIEYISTQYMYNTADKIFQSVTWSSRENVLTKYIFLYLFF